MAGRLVPRLEGLGTTVFADMSALAAATGAVNLGQGFPDTDGPDWVREAAVRALREGRGNQYPPGMGVPALREAVAAHQKRFYGIDLDPDREVLVTVGATEAITAAVLAMVDDGDEVITLDPAFDSYPAAIAMARGVRVPVVLPGPGFRLDADALRAAVTPRTRLLLLNTPHNPTGRLLDADELAVVAAVAAEHDLVVVSDEVYEHLAFDGREHVPFATLPGMADRTLTVGSAGKTFSFTGWKVGWATGPAELVAAARTTKQYLTFVAGGPLQYAVAEALAGPDEVFADLATRLQAGRDRLCSGLVELGLQVPVAPEGTYFVMTDVRPLGWDDGAAFCRELPGRCGVVAIPAEVFYADPAAGAPYVRWAFCKRPEVLDEALRRLRDGGVRR